MPMRLAILADDPNIGGMTDNIGQLDIAGITSDSRQVRPGYLFVAINGVHVDGVQFIGDAKARGAVAVLVSCEAGSDDYALPTITHPNVRSALARMAACFYPEQPGLVAAVTGTNGKTSVASFLRQLWEHMGHRAVSIGTVGVTVGDVTEPLLHTTPDPVELHYRLAELSSEHAITHAVVEASSHGLAQHRLDGLKLEAAAFTNLSRDHLDYHGSMADYLKQKLRLFAELLPTGGIAVINRDGAHAQDVELVARRRGLATLFVGRKGGDLRLVERRREGLTQTLTLAHGEQTRQISLPLVGDFQTENAMMAAGLALACGERIDDIWGGIERLAGATGRLELVARGHQDAPIFVDYAHTPEALRSAIESLRPYARRRLIVVFGAGGDRDAGKRALMGEVVEALADIPIVTDDNPRNEDPADIRAAILAAAPKAIEIGDRYTAISAGIHMLHAGDVLLIAGKGHETGQEIRGHIYPFSDHRAVKEALAGEESLD